MEAQDILRVINELDFILDDIDEISRQLDLTKAENNKMYRAIGRFLLNFFRTLNPLIMKFVKI